MNGNLYSKLPDTTSRMAPYRRSIRRLVASTSLFASSLLLAASMGLAQDDVSCQDFGAPEAAIEYVQSNPEAESALDSDGDGTVCNEQQSVFTGGTSQSDSSGDDGSDDAGDVSDDSSGDRAQQTPATGGVALLPLAGSVLAAGFSGFMFLRRR